jgi:hypothetical protein
LLNSNAPVNTIILASHPVTVIRPHPVQKNSPGNKKPVHS